MRTLTVIAMLILGCSLETKSVVRPASVVAAEAAVCEPREPAFPGRHAFACSERMEDHVVGLVDFLAELRQACRDLGRAGVAPMAPAAVLEAWEIVLESFDRALAESDCPKVRRRLERAAAALELEVALGAEVWRLPGHLEERIGSRLAYLDGFEGQVDPEPPTEPAGVREPMLGWPLKPVTVTSAFGWRRDPLHGGARFHYGVDLAAYAGQLVEAAGAGVVTWAEWNRGHGRHVEIVHAGGWRSRYSHLAIILVREGDEVTPGDPIGLAGTTGRVTGPHLHFEVWDGDDARDPIDVLGEP